jgi:hypothetical protein
VRSFRRRDRRYNICGEHISAKKISKKDLWRKRSDLISKISGGVELIRRDGFSADGGDAYVMAQGADAVVPLLNAVGNLLGMTRRREQIVPLASC